MKSIIVIVIMFIFIREGQGQSNLSYQTNLFLYETECKICDEDISEYKEGSSNWIIDGSSNILHSYYDSTDNKLYNIKYNINYEVCNRCKELYNKKFVEMIDKLAEEFIINAIKESAEYRKEVRYQKKDKRYKMIRNRIKMLEKELEEWKE